METRVDEIADNIFRIGLWTGQAPITFNQFVIRDDCPALIHTGHAALFDTVLSLTCYPGIEVKTLLLETRPPQVNYCDVTTALVGKQH